MASLLGQIGSLAGVGSLLLSTPAQLLQGGVLLPVNVNRLRSQKPYRANENRRSYDAEFRLDRGTSPVEPVQNDRLELANESWIVWRIIPSAAGSHWNLECMAPPTVAAVPLSHERASDGGGGFELVWVEHPDLLFYVVTREASVDSQLSAEASVLNRLAISYPSETVPEGFDSKWRLEIEGIKYEILSITVDDENPFWRNAVLAAEGKS